MEFRKIYRSLQVLNSKFSHCFRHWFFPWNTALCCGMAIVGIYGALTLPDSKSIAMGIVGMVSLVYITAVAEKFGQIYKTSDDLLKVMVQRCIQNKLRHQNNYRFKFMRSCYPLRIFIGNFYPSQMSTVLVACDAVFNLTISLLIG